jgi:hypothetical protein
MGKLLNYPSEKAGEYHPFVKSQLNLFKVISKPSLTFNNYPSKA